jgi:hypothetical protein
MDYAVNGLSVRVNDVHPDIFLFQLPNPLLQELPLWFLLGQGQRLLIKRASLSCPAEPAAHICTGGMRGEEPGIDGASANFHARVRPDSAPQREIKRLLLL